MIDIAKIDREINGSDKRIIFPELRRIAKEIARDDYGYFLENCPKDDFNMKILYGYILGYAKDDFSILLKHFESFIPYINGWADCDTFCQSFKQCRKHREQMWNFLMRYKDSSKEFESRVVSVMLLSHFLTDEYIDRVLLTLDNLFDGEYYAYMGISWAIATALGKFPEQTVEYLKSDVKIRNITYNKALQKARESFRVDDEIKKWTYTMKK